MAFFGVHVVLPHGCDYVQFAPGDEVPDWAVGLVGDHCLAEVFPGAEIRGEHGPELVNFDEPGKVFTSGEAAELLTAGGADTEPVAGPDFTAPAKPARGRPRKS